MLLFTNINHETHTLTYFNFTFIKEQEYIQSNNTKHASIHIEILQKTEKI
jgi:hypothetical protein